MQCILQWAQVTNTCPLCKTKFNDIISSDNEHITIQDRVQVVQDDTVYFGEEQSDDDLSSDNDSDYVPSTPLQTRDAEVDEEINNVPLDNTQEECTRRPKKRKLEDDMAVIVRLCKSFVYQCEVETCGKAFKRKADFDRHILIHQGDEARRFPCDTCGKRFKLKGDLKRHSLSHSSKQFSCEVCDDVFSTKGNLDRHRKTKHMREKRFECEVCEKQFGQSGDLKRHALTHAAPELRPFYCAQCHAGFAQKKNYVAHCKAH